MKSDILSPKQLFQKDVRYVIPTFQRPYVWTQEDQWEPLWDDVRNTAERYVDELERLGIDHKADAERLTPAHFLGAVVLQQQATSAIEIEQRHVIDGQQRLTTLQLLLDAAQQVCEDLELGPEARRLAKLVANDEDFVGSEPANQFKIWPTNVDRDAFRHAMHNGLATDGFAESRIVQGHEFFQLQIREWLHVDESSLPQRVAALETALTGLLQMVVIDLEPKDDAHVIFETLNARGTPLIESDLIKNFILYRATADGQDEEKAYQEYWRAFDTDWWRQEVRQGRLTRPRVDMFLNYWLSMRTVSDVQASRVFDTFQTYSKDRVIGDVAADLKRGGETYRSLEQVTDPVEAAFMYRWRVMDAGVVTPALLLLFGAQTDQLPAPRRQRALRAIESYLIRRMACRFTTKDYNRLFLDLAEVLQKQGLDAADDTVIEFFAQQRADSREWPTDQQFEEAFRTLPLYRLLTRGRLRLLLEGIEGALRTSKAETANVPRDLTIEHIVPQGWRQHWPPPVGEDEESLSIERDRTVHTIGNLTLLNDKLNPDLSNGPWGKKREGLQDHSTLFLNKELLRDYGDTWDDETIRDRSTQLAAIAARVWPHGERMP